MQTDCETMEHAIAEVQKWIPPTQRKAYADHQSQCLRTLHHPKAETIVKRLLPLGRTLADKTAIRIMRAAAKEGIPLVAESVYSPTTGHENLRITHYSYDELSFVEQRFIRQIAVAAARSGQVELKDTLNSLRFSLEASEGEGVHGALRAPPVRYTGREKESRGWYNQDPESYKRWAGFPQLYLAILKERESGGWWLEETHDVAGPVYPDPKVIHHSDYRLPEGVMTPAPLSS